MVTTERASGGRSGGAIRRVATGLDGVDRVPYGRHEVTTAAQTALDAARPNSTYNLQLPRTTGVPVSANVSLVGSYPPTPQITIIYPSRISCNVVE